MQKKANEQNDQNNQIYVNFNKEDVIALEKNKIASFQIRIEDGNENKWISLKAEKYDEKISLSLCILYDDNNSKVDEKYINKIEEKFKEEYNVNEIKWIN